jgi:hypothetical protein
MATRKSLHEGWAALDDLSRGEYGLSLQSLLKQEDESLTFRRIGRLALLCQIQ